jgi:putative transposase
MRYWRKFDRRQLEDVYAYLVLDARYEKVCEGDGVIRGQAVLIAIGVDRKGGALLRPGLSGQ